MKILDTLKESIARFHPKPTTPVVYRPSPEATATVRQVNARSRKVDRLLEEWSQIEKEVKR